VFKKTKDKSKLTIVRDIILYIIGFILFMLGVDSPGASLFSILILLVSVALLLPPVWVLLQNIGFPPSLSKAMILVPAGLVLFVISLFFVDENVVVKKNNSKSISFYSDGSAEQRYLLDLITETQSKFSEKDTDGKRKFYWIEASRKLCASKVFNAFGLQRNWLGKLDQFKLRDDESMYISFKIDGSNYNIVEKTLSKGEAASLGFEANLLKLQKGQYVRFSGSFNKGDSTDNECLDGNFIDTPKLVSNSYKFDFARIELIE
jgi:hypothetical protein|tara:strand:- start:1378 stop:2163 length:786 start_codon:yes stop_codon:yes gene_type:complete